MMSESSEIAGFCQDCQGIDWPNARNLTQQPIVPIPFQR
jgi:hypothetical protein